MCFWWIPQMSPMTWICLSFLFSSFYFFIKMNKNYTHSSQPSDKKQIYSKNKNFKW